MKLNETQIDIFNQCKHKCTIFTENRFYSTPTKEREQDYLDLLTDCLAFLMCWGLYTRFEKFMKEVANHADQRTPNA